MSVYRTIGPLVKGIGLQRLTFNPVKMVEETNILP